MSEYKLAIYLPNFYLGGIFKALKSMVTFLMRGSKEEKLTIYVFLHNKFLEHSTLSFEVDTNNVYILPYTELVASKEVVANIRKTQRRYDDSLLTYDNYIIPIHPTVDTSRMDAWLWLTDRLSLPIAPLVRFGIVPFDFIQRYVPGIIDHADWLIWLKVSLSNLQNADYVYCTSPSTRQDAISYVGIAPNKVKLLPVEVKLPNITFHHQPSKDYILWISNASPHKNHVFTFKALNAFYQRYPNALPTKMIGASINLFSPLNNTLNHSYHIECREILHQSGLFNKKIFIEDYVPDQAYAAYIYNASCLLHSVINDNGTSTFVDACYYRVPTLSSDYPAMRYFSELFDIPLIYFNKNDVENFIAQLNYMLAHIDELSTKLPSKESLLKLTHTDIAAEYWSIYKSTLMSHVCEKEGYSKE